jgi:hypothetical protein
MHALPARHRAQPLEAPPQSTSLSLPPRTPSRQLGGGGDTDAVRVALGLTVAVCEADTVELAVREGDAVTEPVGVPLDVPVTVAEGVGEGVPEDDTDTVVVGERDWLAVGDMDFELVGVADSEIVALAVRDSDLDTVGEDDGEDDAADADAEPEVLGVGVGEGEGEEVPLGVEDATLVPLTATVQLALTPLLTDAETPGVDVTLEVTEADAKGDEEDEADNNGDPVAIAEDDGLAPKESDAV